MSKAAIAIGSNGLRGSRRRRTALMLSGGVLALIVATPAMADAGTELPTGGAVVGGSATIGTPTPGSMQVTQTSNRAVINWDTFNIGQDAQVAFVQPSTTAVALNRVVTGTAPSQIAGKLTSNGIVAVLNANGVIFAGSADVNVGGLIASTGAIDTSSFMAGGNSLAITGANNGEIVVSAGANISVANTGLAAFVAPSVRNSGTITATAGRVQLGAGTAFTLDLTGGLLQVDVGADSPLVQNLGQIFATGGQIQLSAKQAGALLDQTIRTGVLPVGSARLDGNTIVLDAAGSDVQLTSNITGTGNLTLSGARIYGSGDINVDGNLTLNVNAGGTVADTIAGGNNWIGDALGVIGAPVDAATINLGAGSYAAGATINTANVTVNGGGVATVVLPINGTQINGLSVGANGDGATITGIDFAGTIDVPAWTYAWGSTITRGIALANGAENVTVTGNTITGVRNGILVDGRNAGSSITGNLIDNTKSAISVQYSNGATDGPVLNIAGNSQGAFGNEWGVIYHLNGYLDGTTAFSAQGHDGANTPLAEQQRLLAVSAANSGMSVFNQGYTASNRTSVTVAPTGGPSAQGSVATPISSVQGGVNAVVTGGLVNVMPGNYTEGVTGVDYFGGTGSQKFGLYIAKDDITLRGLDASGNAITSADDVAAFITAQYQAGFGAQHFVSGTNVTIEGLGFKPAAGGDNKMLEIIGDNFTLRNSVLDARGNGVSANFYISSFETPGADVVESFTLEDNLIYGATLPYDGVSGAGAIVTIAGGVGRNTDASNRVFSGNRIIGGNLVGQRGFQIQGRIPTTAWQQLTSGAVTITGNSFDNVDIPVRTIGLLTEALDWNAIFRDDGNLFLDGAVMAYVGDTLAARATLTANGDQDFRITSKIADSVSRALAGDTVRMLDGTYNLGTSPLVLDKSISLIGESEAGTILDGRLVGTGPGSNGLGTISVFADDVTLGNFTLYGSEQLLGNYGIKVQPNPGGHVNTAGGDDQRVSNFAISDVTVRGSRRGELDLNGVVGATITNFTADGRRVADGTSTEGAGIQITDSSDVTLTGVHTLGNNWGGVALYQSNKNSGYDAQTTNINIDAAANQFDEAIGLFSQLESTTQGFGQLNLAGFNYAVRNTGHRSDGSQFVFFRTDLADATAFALGLAAPSTSSIEGYAGDHFSNVFTVSSGLSINSAIRDARAGGIVNVGAGTYAETVGISKSLTLDGAGIDATSITGGMLITGSPTGLVLSDFAVSGSGNGTSVINNNGTLTNLTVDHVRIDGGNVADRHGFIGGQIGGDIAITNSEFVNIRGWAAFDTRSGAGGNDGAQITSGVFSNNLIDNTIGHINFRQQGGATTLPDITFSGNTLRGTGNATNSFGAIFKAFNANTVNFTGNNASGVGTSGMVVPAGEAAYGAVLMTRGTAVLNVIGNTFTGNNQVFAVEPGKSLPTVTNFSGNTFTNNAYSIYLPGNVAGAGTINFGAGNNFIAGPATVQHIVWRSSGGLDLTGVSFGGTLGSELSLAQAFAVEDLITDGIDVSGAGLARLAAGQVYVTTGSGTDAALRAVTLASAGDTVNLSAGTHVLNNTLFLQKSLSLVGQGKGLTTIDASNHGTWGIRVQADNSTLSGFTLLGSSANVNTAYGIKVEAGAGNPLNDNFTISDVAISGSRKNGLDLNSVVGALIDGVSVSGVVAGNGIAISDSSDVIVRNSSTSNNAWGGLALYQTNNLGGGGSILQLNNVTVEANNAFSEPAGVYLEATSTLMAPGTITVLGYDYTVRNANQPTFTFFQQTAQNAFDYAAGLASPGSSVVQGWAGSANDHNFYVGLGNLAGGDQQALSLQTAFGASADGDIINVASGTYAEDAALSGSRVLNFGTVTLGGLTLDAATGLQGNLTLATGNFAASGPVTLTGTTSIAAANGDISLGAVSGRQALILNGKALTLGAADLASLTATGTSIATNGVTTTGAQSYIGATTLNGGYGAESFEVNGATTLGGATTIAALGDVTLGTVGGAQALVVGADTVTLGATNVASLAATGSTIATSGVTTSGAQSYGGATTLGGDYSASTFTVNGATTLGGATTIAASGNVVLGTITGPQALTVSGNIVTLGAANIGSLTATGRYTDPGSAIITSGVITTGAQTYTGKLTLTGVYQASSFSAPDYRMFLGGDTSISVTGSADIGWIHDSVDGRPYSFSIAGSRVSINNIGMSAPLGALTIAADEIVLLGTSYRANSIKFSGGQGATVRLTGLNTIFDTGAAAGDIEVTSHLIGTENGKQSVSFITGSGLATDGDILLGNLGTAEIRLGNLSVTGGDFSAATVKLAGNFKSRLGGNQVFSSQTLDTLGNVEVNVAGSESGPIVAGGSVSLVAGGSGTGSITAGGPVDLAYSSEVARAITSQSSVSLTATGPVTGSITATGPVGVSSTGQVSTTVNTGGSANIASTTGVSSNVTAGGGVQLTSTQGAVSGQISSGGAVNVNAAGPVSGSITATDAVGVTSTGPVSTTVHAGTTATIASTTSVSSNVTAGGGVQLTSTQGAVSGSVNSGGPVNVSASGPVSTAVTTTGEANIASSSGVSSTVNAGGPVTVSATSGAVTGAITSGSTVAVTAQGPVSGDISAAGSASLVSTTGGVSSAITAGGPVDVSAPGAVTSTISSGSTVSLTSNTPIDVQITGGAVTINAPGGQVSGVFEQITTGPGGTFLINEQPVVGEGQVDARQIINDHFLAPIGGTIGDGGQIVLPGGFALALIGPGGANLAGRPPVVVNSVEQLGELLRAGYTAIIIQFDKNGTDTAKEIAAN